MTPETLYRLRIPFEVALVFFALLLAWLGARRGE